MEAIEVAGLGMAGVVTLAVFSFNLWSPWDPKRLWDEYGDMAVVRGKMWKRRLPTLGSLGLIWAVGIALQLMGRLVC